MTVNGVDEACGGQAQFRFYEDISALDPTVAGQEVFETRK